MGESGKILSLDLAARFRGKRVNDIDFTDLVETLVAVIQANLEPRLNAEVRKAVAPLQSEVVRLRESLTRVSEYVEKVQLGDPLSAALVLTDSDDAHVDLATAKVDQEQRYPFSAVEIASRIAGKPSTTRVAAVIKGLGLKNDPKYWCELKVGNTVFNRYSKTAFERVSAVFADPRGHLDEDSPAFRTVIDFLEGK